jgi:hypothetical protein
MAGNSFFRWWTAKGCRVEIITEKFSGALISDNLAVFYSRRLLWKVR